MYNCVTVILGIFLVLNLTSAQIPTFGRCPEIEVVPNFDTKFYSGKWYEIEKYFTVFEIGGICITSEYSDLGNGTIGVRNQQVQTISGQVRITEGTARVTDPGGGAKLGFRFPTVAIAGESPYWIVDTDYKKYSIVWSCSSFGFMSFRIVWFLARERNPSEEIRSRVYAKLKQLQIPTDPLQKTQQDGCSG